MTSIMETHFYHSDIMAYESVPTYINLSQLQSNEDDDVLPILFRLYKSIETMLISDVGVIHEETATDLEDKRNSLESPEPIPELVQRW
ncbi:hypothetical protein M0R45_004639 [Rubus argutus]|uniref:Uncharacterized protein n=1 Tax=Rubus argutus TaxID=59490 RepID=A0AAW1YKE6_RUBAR